MFTNIKTHLAAVVSNSDIGLPETPADSNSITLILQIVFGIIGALTVLFIIVGGFKLVLSEGEPQKIAQARRGIIFAVVGLVVALLAEVLVTFVLGQL